jgi:hypothetical protein
MGLPIEAWERYRDRLALGIIDTNQWTVVAEAIGSLMHFRLTTEGSLTEPGVLAAPLVVSVNELRAKILAAAAVLGPLASMPALTTPGARKEGVKDI